MSSALSGFSETGNNCPSHGKPSDFSLFHLYSQLVLCDSVFCTCEKRWRSVNSNSVLAFIDPKSGLGCLWLCLVLGIRAHTPFMCGSVCSVVDWLTSDCVSLHWVPVSSLYSFEYSHQSLWASVCHSLPPSAYFLSKCVRLCVCM